MTNRPKIHDFYKKVNINRRNFNSRFEHNISKIIIMPAKAKNTRTWGVNTSKGIFPHFCKRFYKRTDLCSEVFNFSSRGCVAR